jgi:SAM-dependent methyltransferase
MSVQNSWNAAFSTHDKQTDRFIEHLGRCLGNEMRSRPLEFLDVGCGDGGKLARLAELFPQARLTGVDISGPNIRQAERRRLSGPARDRLNFILGDYRELSLPRFDVILSDSTLHLIPGSTDELFSKLSRELNPGGLLCFTIPCRCFFNALLATFRRTMRLIRSRFTDRLIMSLAATLHGSSHSREFLRERLQYMYILPNRYGSRALQRRLSKHHQLATETAEAFAHASLGQLKHRFYALRRQA